MKWLRRCSITALIVGMSLMGLTLHVQSQDAAGQPEEKWLVDRALTLSPRPEPKQAMALRLFPLATERKEGNAVPIYLRLTHEQNDAARKDWTETPKKWNELPIEKMPLDEAKAFLNRYQRFLRQFELGARRRTAEWNYTLDEGSVIDILLPDAQMMRGYVPMMVLKVRVELAEGNFAAAAHWLETGFAYSNHIGRGPFLITSLVGVACASQFADCVLDFVQRPDAPNLYWSLTALPRPLIDMRDPFEFEYHFFELQFPDLTELHRPRSPEQWDAVLKRVRTEHERITQSMPESTGPSVPPPFHGTTAEDHAAKSPDLAVARKHLTDERKWTPEKVAALPPAQVLLLYMMDTISAFRDDCFKAVHLPPAEAARALAAAEARRKASPNTEAKRFADLLLPAIGKVQLAQTRLDRRIAALRVIEALRLHAAANNGKLPDKLSEVSIVPVPNDPGTDKPFEYQRDGDTATLISRVPGEKLEATGLRYRLTMRKH